MLSVCQILENWRKFNFSEISTENLEIWNLLGKILNYNQTARIPQLNVLKVIVWNIFQPNCSCKMLPFKWFQQIDYNYKAKYKVLDTMQIKNGTHAIEKWILVEFDSIALKYPF